MQFESAYTNSSWKRLWIHCDDCCKNVTKALYLIRHIQTLNESHKTQDWNYKSQLIMRRKRFNCDQCGKNFARGCNMKLLLQNVHKIDSWNELWTLWQKFHQSIQFIKKYMNSSWITQNTRLKLKITGFHKNI